MSEKNKIKVGAVSYLNTKPLMYGMQTEAFLQGHELVPDYPAKVAELLKSGEVDVALVPVALLHELPTYYIVSDYCIASEYEVASVCLFSEVPVEQLTTVYLDYQSRTSVALAKLLMKEFWGISPQLIDATDESYRTKIEGTTGAVVIGDRALEQRRLSTYIYDLATDWRAMTHLPFVFAVWVSLKPMNEDWISRFNAANAAGLKAIDEIAEQQKYPVYDLRKYYTHNISYLLDDEKRKGMQKFLEFLNA
ncbi:MAG: menaquinone biosynthesis protein [Lacibacter sp.]|nr:menaquinone biosynthesis protein [Lacibacter sp.]